MTICLAMNVRNEAAVVARALRSSLPLVDSWCIVDTGSTDETIATIEREVGGKTGNLRRYDWRGFGESKTRLFEQARGMADYVLMLEADEELRTESRFSWPELTAGGYRIRMRQANWGWKSLRLLRSDTPWHFPGERHTVAHCDAPHEVDNLPGLRILNHNDGTNGKARDPKRFELDAEHFRDALRKNPEDEHAAFYLAQSLRDAGRIDEAITAYMRCAGTHGVWHERAFWALYQAARLADFRGWPPDIVRGIYERADKVLPYRAEPAFRIAELLHRAGYNDGYAVRHAQEAARRAERYPDNWRFFVEDDVYEWRAHALLADAGMAAGDVDAVKRGASFALNYAPPAERLRMTRLFAEAGKRAA